MSLDADLIADRRRIRRKLTFWRVTAIALIVLGIAGVGVMTSNRMGLVGVRPYIARVTISGLIRGDRDRVEQLDRLGRSPTARAVIVHVDSPGGTTAGSEQSSTRSRGCGRKSPWSSSSTAWQRPAVTLPRLPAITLWPSRPRWSVRSACCFSIRTLPSSSARSASRWRR